MKKEYKTSLVSSLGVLAYITIVALIMQNGNRWFGAKDTWVTPIAVLLLFSLSALVVGSLIVGKPIMLYLDGNKKEAVQMLIASIGWLALFTAVFLVSIAIFS